MDGRQTRGRPEGADPLLQRARGAPRPPAQPSRRPGRQRPPSQQRRPTRHVPPLPGQAAWAHHCLVRCRVQHGAKRRHERSREDAVHHGATIAALLVLVRAGEAARGHRRVAHGGAAAAGRAGGRDRRASARHRGGAAGCWPGPGRAAGRCRVAHCGIAASRVRLGCNAFESRRAPPAAHAHGLRAAPFAGPAPASESAGNVRRCGPRSSGQARPGQRCCCAGGASSPGPVG